MRDGGKGRLASSSTSESRKRMLKAAREDEKCGWPEVGEGLWGGGRRILENNCRDIYGGDQNSPRLTNATL